MNTPTYGFPRGTGCNQGTSETFPYPYRKAFSFPCWLLRLCQVQVMGTDFLATALKKGPFQILIWVVCVYFHAQRGKTDQKVAQRAPNSIPDPWEDLNMD